MYNEHYGGLPRDKKFPEEFINSNEAWRQYQSNTGYYNSSAIPVEKPLYSPLVYSKLSNIPAFEFDPANDNNYLVQKQITKYLQYKFLDKWIYEDFPELFKFVKIKSAKNDLEQKADYIEENILTTDKTRKILKKIMFENDLRWYELPYFESLVKKTFAHYIRKKLKGGKYSDDL